MIEALALALVAVALGAPAVIVATLLGSAVLPSWCQRCSARGPRSARFAQPARDAGARTAARDLEIAVNCPFCASEARNVATHGHDGVILRCDCSDTDIEITPPGLAR